MTRGLSTENAGAANAKVVRPVYLIRLDYESGDVLAASTPFSIFYDWNGDLEAEDFLGVGGLGGMSTLQEGSTLQTYSLTLELSGVSDEHLALALNEHYQGRDCRVWKGFLDENHALVDDPFIIFRGRMDTQVIDMQAGRISVNVVSRLADWYRPRIRRYTNEDQQAEYPGDKGLEYVAQLVEKQLVWGQ